MEKQYTSGNDLPSNNLLGISIEGETRRKLQSIITWSKITAIGGIVNIGLGLINTFANYNTLTYYKDTTTFIIIQIVSLIIGLFLNFFLWQFSKRLKTSLDNENQEAFVQASAQLKAYMRMLGILLITSIVLGLVSGGLFSAFRRF